MTVTERVAYVKGLFEGLDLDCEKKEGKVLKAMLEVMDDLAQNVADLQHQNQELRAQLDDVFCDVSSLMDEMPQDDDFDIAYGEDDGEPMYQVVCPTCGENLYLDDAMLDEGSIACPACGEELEFDLSALESDDSYDDTDDDNTDEE